MKLNTVDKILIIIYLNIIGYTCVMLLHPSIIINTIIDNGIEIIDDAEIKDNIRIMRPYKFSLDITSLKDYNNFVIDKDIIPKARSIYEILHLPIPQGEPLAIQDKVIIAVFFTWPIIMGGIVLILQ